MASKTDARCPVLCESYRQWIIEATFIAGRPALEDVGVQFVTDVEPYEKMKVRLLNGSHSALSYIAYLMGYRNVDEAMADPKLQRFIAGYMREDIVPTLEPVPGIDLDRSLRLSDALEEEAQVRKLELRK